VSEVFSWDQRLEKGGKYIYYPNKKNLATKRSSITGRKDAKAFNSTETWERRGRRDDPQGRSERDKTKGKAAAALWTPEKKKQSSNKDNSARRKSHLEGSRTRRGVSDVLYFTRRKKREDTYLSFCGKEENSGSRDKVIERPQRCDRPRRPRRLSAARGEKKGRTNSINQSNWEGPKKKKSLVPQKGRPARHPAREKKKLLRCRSAPSRKKKDRDFLS